MCIRKDGPNWVSFDSCRMPWHEGWTTGEPARSTKLDGIEFACDRLAIRRSTGNGKSWSEFGQLPSTAMMCDSFAHIGQTMDGVVIDALFVD
jgi:hypothetical protein